MVHVGTWRLKGNGNVDKRLKDMILNWLFIKIKNMTFQTYNCTNATQTKKFNTCNEYAVREGLAMCPGKTITVLSMTTFLSGRLLWKPEYSNLWMYLWDGLHFTFYAFCFFAWFWNLSPDMRMVWLFLSF